MKKNLLSMGLCFIMMVMLSGCSMTGSEYKKGIKNYENGNYEEAAASFAAAIASNPNRADYYIDYGMTLIALGRQEDALAQFDLAYMDKDILLIKENNKRVYRGKGIAYYHLLKYQEAINEFNLALNISELSGLDMDILYYMGDSLMAMGSYQEAAAAYTSLLSTEEENTIAYNNRALCYRNMGDYEKSLADYDMAITLEPANYRAYFGKYYLLAENKDEVGAGEVLAKASEIVVKTKEDKYNMAKVHYLQKNYELALAELSEGYNNGFTEAYYYLGELYRIQKDYPKAIYYYEIFIKEGEAVTPNVFNQIASCYIKSGDYKNAISYLEQGIAFNQANTLQTLKKNEIIAYEGLSMYDKAKEKLEEYLIRYPEDTQAIREAEFIKTRLMEVEIEDNVD